MAAAEASVVRKVFLSSTAQDLGPFREAVYKAISGMDGFQCVRQEDFGARDWKAEDFCIDAAAAGDGCERLPEPGRGLHRPPDSDSAEGTEGA